MLTKLTVKKIMWLCFWAYQIAGLVALYYYWPEFVEQYQDIQARVNEVFS